MTRLTTCAIGLTIAAAAVAIIAQATPQQPVGPGQPTGGSGRGGGRGGSGRGGGRGGSGRGGGGNVAAPPGPNSNSQYRLGPDSMPQDGVPKGEIQGPFHIQSNVYPRHPAYLLGLCTRAIRSCNPRRADGLSGRSGFQRSQRRSARPERHGQPDLPPRNSGDDRRLHQSRPHAGTARAAIRERRLGRPAPPIAPPSTTRPTTSTRASSPKS